MLSELGWYQPAKKLVEMWNEECIKADNGEYGDNPSDYDDPITVIENVCERIFGMTIYDVKDQLTAETAILNMTEDERDEKQCINCAAYHEGCCNLDGLTMELPVNRYCAFWISSSQ